MTINHRVEETLLNPFYDTQRKLLCFSQQCRDRVYKYVDGYLHECLL